MGQRNRFIQLTAMLRQHSGAGARRSGAAQRRYETPTRKTALAFGQQLATSHSASTTVRDDDSSGKSKPAVQVQFSRPPLPCEKPLPLANVMEVQRLLYLLEAPEYCMRAFREHGLNGQDLLELHTEDLDDSRFKFPRHVQRKVLRVAHAWRGFQALCGGPSCTSLSLVRFLDYHRAAGCSAEALKQLQFAFQAVDVNDNGHIGFEEFLMGFALIEEAAAFRATSTGPCSSSAATDAAAALPIIQAISNLSSPSSASPASIPTPSISSSNVNSLTEITAAPLVVATATEEAESPAPQLPSQPSGAAASTAHGGDLVRSLMANILGL